MIDAFLLLYLKRTHTLILGLKRSLDGMALSLTNIEALLVVRASSLIL